MTCNTHVAPKDRQSASARSAECFRAFRKHQCGGCGGKMGGNVLPRASRSTLAPAKCLRVLPEALWRLQSASKCSRKHSGDCNVLSGCRQRASACLRKHAGGGRVLPSAFGRTKVLAECFRVLLEALWRRQSASVCVCARAKCVREVCEVEERCHNVLFQIPKSENRNPK